jgi:hypothetical protein
MVIELDGSALNEFKQVIAVSEFSIYKQRLILPLRIKNP